MNFLNQNPSTRGSTTAVAVIISVLKIVGPLIVIALAALWVVSYQSHPTSVLRVTSTIPGAEIYLAGVQTGYSTDTTLPNVPTGRTIITVRKSGYIADPEVQIVDIQDGIRTRVHFVMKEEKDVKTIDSIPPLHSIRQETFSTGLPMRSVPPGPGRRHDLIDVLRGSGASERPTETYYRPSETKLRQTDSSSVETTAQLPQSLKGTEVIVTSIPNGAEILVNGSLTLNLTPYTFHGLDRGVYVFAVRKVGHVTKPDSVIVTLSRDFQNELAAFELVQDKTLPQPTLTISTSPPAAGIRIDGRPVGVGKAVVDVTMGKHTIEFAEAPGYHTPDPVSVDVTLAQPKMDVNGVYQRLEGNAFIAIRSGDEGKKITGTTLRVFIDNELVLDSPKQTFDVALIGKIAAGSRLIKVQFGDLSEDITVNLLDGEVKDISFRAESFFSKRKLKLRERESMNQEEWQKKSKRLVIFSES